MKCVICGSEAQVFSVKKKNYFLCSCCEVVFKHPQDWPDSVSEKNRYLLHQNHSEDKGYVDYLNGFLEKSVLPFLPNRSQKPLKVLDYGCGSEPVLAGLMTQRGWQVRSYDVFFQPDVSVFTQKYHVIVSTEVFEHLHNPRDVFGKLAGLLHKGGILSVLTQFHPHPFGENFANWWYLRDLTHVVFFNRSTFEWLAKKFGLDLVWTDNQKQVVFRAAL